MVSLLIDLFDVAPRHKVLLAPRWGGEGED